MSFFDRLGQKLQQLVDELDIPDAIREPFDRGREALAAEEWSAAEGHFRRAVAAAPSYVPAWRLLGLCLSRQDRPGAARDALAQAARLEPEDSGLLVELAEAERTAGDDAAALQAFRRALSGKIDERALGRVYGGMGEIFLERGQVDHAVRELRKAVAASEGKDLRLVGLLGRAQRRAGQLSLARHSLERAAAAVPARREVLLDLAAVLLELGQHAEAQLAARRLLEAHPGDARGRCALARALLRSGEVGAARDELLRALEREPGLADAHAALADACLAARDPSTALGHLRTALGLLDGQARGTRIRTLRQALELSLELGPDPHTADEAEALIALEPDDPLGLACVALARPGEARALAERSLARRETYAGRLAQGLVLLEAREPAAAATALRTALRLNPTGAAARRALERAHDALAGGPAADPLSFYPALGRIRALLLAQPDLVAQGTEVARIQEVFDRPLLVTVMGEFSSGKSTFVNALVGEEVAPMGVTPTTATINILKYGERRGARVLWRDDREDRLDWEAVGPFLRGLDRDRAQRIRLVELLFPAEELLRVNVVDTPGLNSMLDEHEQTAREFLAQADAVIWLFSAQQAGKRTEQEALELMREHRLKTVGVLNKVDQLTAEETGAVLRHLEREFAGLVDAVIPVAARPALDALAAPQPEALEASRFPELRRVLEERLFSRSRRIKREACQRRLDTVLGAVFARSEAALGQADHALAQVDGLDAWVRQAAADTRFVEGERAELRRALEEVYERAAAEVLDFVRPRRWALGEHRATLADRDFLLELLLDGGEGVAEGSFARAAEQLGRLRAHLAAGLDAALPAPTLAAPRGALASLGAALADRLGLLRQQVYARYLAFSRGFLRGGRVDAFFEHKLPRLELSTSAIRRELLEGSVDIEGELLGPLADWREGTLELARRQLAQVRLEVDLFRLELDRRVVTPLLEIQRRLEPIDSPPSAPEAGP